MHVKSMQLLILVLIVSSRRDHCTDFPIVRSTKMTDIRNARVFRILNAAIRREYVKFRLLYKPNNYNTAQHLLRIAQNKFRMFYYLSPNLTVARTIKVINAILWNMSKKSDIDAQGLLLHKHIARIYIIARNIFSLCENTPIFPGKSEYVATIKAKTFEQIKISLYL